MSDARQSKKPAKITMTQEEIDAVRDAFNQYDKDRSGTIDQFELKSVLEAMGQEPTDEDTFAMITELDDDNSGTIDFAEFLKVVLVQKVRRRLGARTAAALRCASKGPGGTNWRSSLMLREGSTARSQ